LFDGFRSDSVALCFVLFLEYIATSEYCSC